MLEIRKKRVGTSTLKYKFVKICGNLWLIQATTNHTNFHEYFLLNPLNLCEPHKAAKKRISGKFLGIDQALLPNCEWNKKQKHKKQPWSNVECFAFGGATVRFASLETSFHAANHTIPPPPSYEGSPHCPKDKNRSPFHGEKPLVIK